MKCRSFFMNTEYQIFFVLQIYLNVSHKSKVAHMYIFTYKISDLNVPKILFKRPI